MHMTDFIKLLLSAHFFPDRLSGKEHSVFTGVAIIHCSSKGTCVILLKLNICLKLFSLRK